MLSVVVPIYNEIAVLELFYQSLIAKAEKWKYPFEVVLVDDGSQDGSSNLLRNLAVEDARFTYIRLTRNFGQQAAIGAGLKQAKGDAVVILDADLQDPPEVIDQFIGKWEEGYKIVFGIRHRRQEAFYLKLIYAFFYRFLNLISNINIPLDSGDFCLLDRQVVDILNAQFPENTRFMRGLRAYTGFSQIGIRYQRAPRAKGKSKYSFLKLLKLAFDGIFDYSTFPLRIASYTGFFIALVFFMLGIFFIFHRIFDFKIFGYSPADVPGLATLAVGLFFLGGIILMVLGVIGEYIGRIYFEVKKRPPFLIEEIYKQDLQREPR